MNALDRILSQAVAKVRTFKPEESPAAMAHAGEYATLMGTLGTLTQELARTQDALTEALGLIAELSLATQQRCNELDAAGQPMSRASKVVKP